MSKLAHIRTLGSGDPGWNGRAIYHMVGADPSVSYYDAPSAIRDDSLGNRIRGGIHTMHERLRLDAPTMNREARSAATQSSVPAARFFQGYFQTSFQTAALSDLTPTAGQIPSRPLTQNFNPGAFGTKELHPATTYDPFPAGAAFYPKVV